MLVISSIFDYFLLQWYKKYTEEKSQNFPSHFKYTYESSSHACIFIWLPWKGKKLHWTYNSLSSIFLSSLRYLLHKNKWVSECVCYHKNMMKKQRNEKNLNQNTSERWLFLSSSRNLCLLNVNFAAIDVMKRPPIYHKYIEWLQCEERENERPQKHSNTPPKLSIIFLYIFFHHFQHAHTQLILIHPPIYVIEKVYYFQ